MIFLVEAEGSAGRNDFVLPLLERLPLVKYNVLYRLDLVLVIDRVILPLTRTITNVLGCPTKLPAIGI